MANVDHTENIIELDGVSFAYGERSVLSNVTLRVHKGDYLGIVGGNGSGKTTLVKILLGLLQPSSGTVRLFGTPLEEFRDWSKIGYVPQKVTNFDANFPATVLEVVLMGRYGKLGLFRSTTSQDVVAAEKSLKQVGLWEYRNRLIGDLSGGQQQRAFIARALTGEPEIMVLDEPTVGVEQGVKEDFYTLLRKLNVEMNLTIVLITHDIQSMTTEAMHIACVDKTVYFHDSLDAYFKSTHNHTHPHS